MKYWRTTSKELNLLTEAALLQPPPSRLNQISLVDIQPNPQRIQLTPSMSKS
jgi:hypothetical protein